MSLLSWVGKVIGLRDGQFWSAFYGGQNWAGRSVTVDNSLNLSAWWSGVRLYAGVSGAMPLKIYKRVGEDDRVQARDHWLSVIISQQPNEDQHAQELWAGLAASLAGMGNAYAEKQMIGNRVVGLDPLPIDTLPDRKRNQDGRLQYVYCDRGKEEVLPREKVFHIRGFTFGKSDVGLSPLSAARQALSISLATEESAGKTFAQGMRASGFFSGPKLNAEQRKDFTKTFIDPLLGNDAEAHYGILENGFEFKPVNIPPKDAEMLLSRRFNVEEICRFMGVPPILVGHGSEGTTAWGTGIEAIINTWLTLGLDSHLSYIEKSINRWLLKPEERATYFAEFDRRALLRADSAARGELYWKLAQLSAMTPNQICARENFPQFEGGDVRLINSTLRPLDQAGLPAPTAPAAAIPEVKP